MPVTRTVKKKIGKTGYMFLLKRILLYLRGCFENVQET